jgi:hypothetical protein
VRRQRPNVGPREGWRGECGRAATGTTARRRTRGGVGERCGVRGPDGILLGGCRGWLAVGVPRRDLAVDPALLVAGLGELLGVLERPRHLLTRRPLLGQRGLTLTGEAVGEAGEVLDAVLELADQRQTVLAELAALERWPARPAGRGG